MSISEKLTTIAENEQKVYDAGYEKGNQAGYDNGYIQAYDDYWTAINLSEVQTDGNRRFVGWNINEKTFRPQKDFVFSTCRRMFRKTKGYYDLVDLCKKRGVTMILAPSTAANAVEMFSNAEVVRVGEVDMSNVTQSEYCGAFAWTGVLQTIENIIVTENTTYRSWFDSSTK